MVGAGCAVAFLLCGARGGGLGGSVLPHGPGNEMLACTGMAYTQRDYTKPAVFFVARANIYSF